MLLKGQPVDLAHCGNPAAISGSFLSALLRGAFKDNTIGPDGVSVVNGFIEGDIDLSSSQISHRLKFQNVEFKGRVDFRECELGGHVDLRGSVFRRGADFGAAQLHRAVELEYAQFCEPATFAGMSVNGAVYLDNAVFAAGADFSDVSITGTLQAYNTSFVSEAPRRLPPELMAAAHPAPCEPSENRRVTKLRQMDIEGSLILVDDHFGALDARQLRVGHDWRLIRDRFEDDFDISGSNVGQLLYLVAPLVPKNHIWLDGLHYGGVRSSVKVPETSEDTWESLKDLFAWGEFDRDVYRRLEEYFENRGETSLANDVFITMNVQARQHLTFFSNFWNLVQWAVLRYGRYPGWAFVWSFGVVLAGIGVFREDRMKPRLDRPSATNYSRFWYSLDAFLPLTHLDAVDEWVPRPGQWPVWLYFRCHQLLGWILIPLALASVTGIIK